jgi:predicted RNA-binding protein with PUA-like domain
MIWTLFYYNSLPDFPQKCPFFLYDVMYRDFFMCNPTNTGHYTYPKFETLSYDDGCHGREVRNFLKKDDPEKYVIFYTKHEGVNKVVGYFKVPQTSSKEKTGFKSSETVLLPKDKCIEINYTSRGVPVSWGNSSIKPKIEKILKQLISDRKKDISDQYKHSTKKIMDLLDTSTGQNKIITVCEKCSYKTDCYWGKYPKEKKINRLNELYGKKTEPC